MQVSSPTATTVVTNVTGCFGDASGAIDLTIIDGQAPFTYTWSNGETTEDLDSLAAGTYTVTVIDVNGCSTTASGTVTQPTQVIASSMVVTNVTCNGAANGSVNLTPSGGTSPYAFNWSNGASTEDISGLTPGTYDVTVTDFNGCTATGTANITQPVVLDATIVSVTDVNCQNLLSGAVNINVTGGTSPYNFVWSNGTTTEDISSVGGGTYFVTVSDAQGCTDTLSAVIDPAIAVTATINVVDTVSCNGGSNGNLSVSTSGGTSPFTYAWSNGATTQSIANLSGGTYTVTVTDATGCSSVQTLQLANPAIPNFTAGGSTVVCGSDGTLSGTLPNGYTGIWTLLNGTGNISDPTLQVTAVSSLGNGTNQFVWTITNGTCTFADTATLITTVLIIDAGNDQSTCDTLNLQLSGSLSSGSGTWNSPDNGISFSVASDPNATASGLTVGPNIIIWTVTDGNCIEIDTLIITVKPPEECIEDSLEMPTGFSPNGDGPNDFFVIHGLVRYPDNELKVFNRWGNLVYQKKNYNNEWNGTNNNGDKLPDGTYFAIFIVTNQPKLTLTGYVDMRR